MKTKTTEPEKDTTPYKWSFLTNHLHVVVCLQRNAATTVRKLAVQIGITERSVQRILSELEEGDAITREKIGRNNHYKINANHRLHHPLEKNHTIGELLDLLEA